MSTDARREEATGAQRERVTRVLGKGRTQIAQWVTRYGIDVQPLGPR
jgi:hypothetical protein